MGAEEVTDEAIEDLRERMRLLQGDRKANIDLLETSKTANKETIRKMRAENKELRTELATVKGGKWALGGDDDMEEVQEVKAQVHRLRKQNDDLRHRGAAQAKILDAKLASLESRKHEDPAWAELPEMIQYYDEQVLGLETSLTRRSEQEIQRSGKATAKDFEALQNGQYTAMGLKMIDDKFEEQKPGAEEVSHGKKLIMKQPNS